jgi:hypothetical protein
MISTNQPTSCILPPGIQRQRPFDQSRVEAQSLINDRIRLSHADRVSKSADPAGIKKEDIECWIVWEAAIERLWDKS